jgi:hypothetical protein
MKNTTLRKMTRIFGIGSKNAILIFKKIGLNTRKQPAKVKLIHKNYFKKISVLENTDKKLKMNLLDRINFYKKNKIKTVNFKQKKISTKNVTKVRKRS